MQMVKVEPKDHKTKSESKCKTDNTSVGQRQHNIQTTIVRVVKVSLLSCIQFQLFLWYFVFHYVSF